MNMDFVTYEISKKVKEKGFPLVDYIPTISQVLKWLREEKKIYISVEVELEDWFEYKIVQLIKNTRCTSSHVYETYNDAMLAGIEYVLNNLI